MEKPGGGAIIGSEDCLYLNVYRPVKADRAHPLPVLVFLHGGSNQRGSGTEYDPGDMVAKTNIVVVTVNYRLSVFGFLANPALDAELGGPSSGNYGLMDQQAALGWVQRNIRAFGGDPDNVTLAGESAGGIDVCANLVSPPAGGLFGKAILQSMYCPAVAHEDALKTGAPVALKLGCANPESAADCMRAKAPAEVLQAAQPLAVEPGAARGFSASPNFGGRLLPLEPLRALEAGRWNKSPVLIGSNRDELTLFVGAAFARIRPGTSFGERAYKLLAARRWGALAPAVLKEYPLDQYGDPFEAYSAAVTDASPLGCAVSSLAQALSAVTPTFRYEFNDRTAPAPPAIDIPRGSSLGAYHGAELQYLFRMTRLPGPQTAAQRDLSERMMRYWASFVESGDPNSAGLAAWPQYHAGARELLSLSPAGDAAIDSFDREHHCDFWKAHAAGLAGRGIRQNGD